MRLFASLLVIAAAAYIAFVVITRERTPSPETTPEPEGVSGEVAAKPEPETPAEPAFKSKIPISEGSPGEKHLAPADIFYLIERVSVAQPTGIVAAVPGDKVQLLKRNPNGTMKVKLRVKTEVYEFDVKESQVTNDMDVAREAEKKFTLEHPTAR
jgi:hypothetical protein